MLDKSPSMKSKLHFSFHIFSAEVLLQLHNFGTNASFRLPSYYQCVILALTLSQSIKRSSMKSCSFSWILSSSPAISRWIQWFLLEFQFPHIKQAFFHISCLNLPLWWFILDVSCRFSIIFIFLLLPLLALDVSSSVSIFFFPHPLMFAMMLSLQLFFTIIWIILIWHCFSLLWIFAFRGSCSSHLWSLKFKFSLIFLLLCFISFY